MCTKQGNNRNRIRIKKLTVYALLVSACLIVSYLESLLSITFMAIAPGVKIGISNAIVLVLVFKGDKKGAWAVNVTRICLSALLFGTPLSFLLSLAGGVSSIVVACALSKSKAFSAIGISIASAVTHNIFQLVAATVFTGIGVIYYLPVLLLLGAICGAFCGILAQLVLKHSKKLNLDV